MPVRHQAILVFVLIGDFAAMDVAHGQSCKVCADQQKVCTKNYAGPTCKSEYQKCMKSCKK